MGKFLHNRQVCASGKGALSSVCVDYANAVSQGERSHEGGHHHIPTPKADNSTQRNCWVFLHRNGEYDRQCQSCGDSGQEYPGLSTHHWGSANVEPVGSHLPTLSPHMCVQPPRTLDVQCFALLVPQDFFLFKNHRMQKQLMTDIIRRLNIEMNQPVTPGPWLGTNYTDR